jgi:hypothetical protein
MYHSEKLNQQIQAFAVFSTADKKFLNLYDKAMNQPGDMSDKEYSHLSTWIAQKVNDSEFNRTIIEFSDSIKHDDNNNEFPYLDVLQMFIHPNPSDETVRKFLNSQMLTNDEIDTLKAFKAKSRCIHIFQSEKGLDLSLDAMSLKLLEELRPFDPGLYTINKAINESKDLNDEDKKFLLLYHRLMNGTQEASDEDKSSLSQELVKKLEDKSFNKRIVCVRPNTPTIQFQSDSTY